MPVSDQVVGADAVRLITRRATPQTRALVTLPDLWLCLTLPMYWLLAWTLPERWWSAVCSRLLEPLDRKGSNSAISDAVVASGLASTLGIDGRDIARALNAHRIESYFQYLRAYRPGGWRCRIVLEGEEALRRARADGRGVVLWVGHFVFNGIAPKRSLAEAGYDVSHLSRPEHGFSSSRFGISVLNVIRSNIEARYVTKRILIRRGAEERAVREAHKCLKRGGIVSITAGAWEGRQVGLVPLGEAAFPLATGAPALAHSTGAGLIPVFVARSTAEGQPFIRVVVGTPIPVDAAADRDDVLRACLTDFARQQLPFIARHPDQWRGWKYLRY
jgi:lauroyl/myristoyl acyltransferase